MSVSSILLASQSARTYLNPVVLADYSPPGPAAGDLLGIIAWSASAIGVGGVIATGIQLAIQMQRGVPGEGAGYARNLAIVLLACVLASTAGPIVQFLGPFNLQ